MFSQPGLELAPKLDNTGHLDGSVCYWLGSWSCGPKSICLWLRSWSQGPGIESHIRVPHRKPVSPSACVSPSLFLCLSWINKILKEKKNWISWTWRCWNSLTLDDQHWEKADSKLLPDAKLTRILRSPCLGSLTTHSLSIRFFFSIPVLSYDFYLDREWRHSIIVLVLLAALKVMPLPILV